MFLCILSSALIKVGLLSLSSVAKTIQFTLFIKEKLVGFIYLFCMIFVFDVGADTRVILRFLDTLLFGRKQKINILVENDQTPAPS